MKPLHVFFALVPVTIWGGSFVVMKEGITQLPPFFLLTFRFALTAAILLPLVRVPWAQLKQIYVLSITMGILNFGLLFLAVRGLDASTAAIAVQISVPFGAVLSWVFFADRLGWRGPTGMVFAFAGVVMVAGDPRIGADLMPLIIVIGAAFFFAVANVQIKQLGPIDNNALNAWMMLFAAPQMLLVSLVFEDGQIAALGAADWRGYGAILYLVVLASIIGHGLWYFLLGRYNVNQIMPFTFLVPAIGVISGVVVLDEPLTWRIVGGGLVTTLGVALIVFRRGTGQDAEAAEV